MTAPPNTAPSPASFQSLMAFDFGLRRVGVAKGLRQLGHGMPLPTIKAEGKAVFEPIAVLIKAWEPQALVVGVPRHPDGAEHDMTRRARKFAAQLRGRFYLPVFEVDERYTSACAQDEGAQDLDAAAAVLILEQFLRESS
ncbi:Holliday junction resolvase RuvX [Roseateles sp. BYS180W]|uniref:Putative pre-16S rRNA nuclease n=1 Tax=Roseateles rivi TaxID=3299028 RepID=A0ABW7FRQ3_9BURK